MRSIVNPKISFLEILKIKAARNGGLSLDDILKDVHRVVMKMKLPTKQKIHLIQRMAEIEYRVAQGCSEKTQIASLVGAFIEVRTLKK
jgi:replication factor C subunit 3/5